MRKVIQYLHNYVNHLKGAFKNYTFFALYLISRPKILTLIFKGIYIPQYLQYEWISKHQIGTFIDIGANDGNISKVINYLFPKTKIYAFEPIKRKVGSIKSRIISDKLVVESLALGDHTGYDMFYEYDFSAASSFLKPIPKNFNKHIQIAKSYLVKVTTLDLYFNQIKLKKPIIVKMDTEGTENLIIKGGQELLRQASSIIIESSFAKYRKNQCLFDEIYGYLTKLGFEYKGSMPDSNFYPVFGPVRVENAIFIKNR